MRAASWTGHPVIKPYNQERLYLRRDITQKVVEKYLRAEQTGGPHLEVH